MIQSKLLIAASLLFLALVICGCGKKEESVKVPASAYITNPSGLKWVDLEVGSGAEAVSGTTVTIDYTGKLDNGKVFDSSTKPGNKPLDFTVGAKNVVDGMDEGVLGMRVGGTRDLIIPPGLGYGEDDYGPIPGNSTLHFKVKLIAVK